MQTPPPFKSGNLDIKIAQWAKKYIWAYNFISHHIVFWRCGRSKGAFWAPFKFCFWAPEEIQFSSKVANILKWIGIDLTLVFCINDFLCAILSCSDMINFVFFFAGLNRNLKNYYFFWAGSSAPPHPASGARPPGPACFRIYNPSWNRLASTE